jgi:hypothetical protein
MIRCILWSVCLWLLFSAEARAYQLRQTDSGALIRWQRNEIKYTVNRDMSKDLDKTAAFMEIQRSFDTWAKAMNRDLRFEFAGYSALREAGYDQDQPQNNENLIYWEEEDSSYLTDAIALTIVTYRANSGEIVDSDIVLNGVQFRWVIANPSDSNVRHIEPSSARPAIDLGNTMAHEIGHFLGLGHSEDLDATMYYSQRELETTKRELHADDINGIIALYAVEQDLPSHHSMPPPPMNMGCSALAPSATKMSSGGLIAMLFLFVWARLQRRRTIHWLG